MASCNFIGEVFLRLGCRRRTMWCCWWSPGAVPALLGAWKKGSDPHGWWLGDRCRWLLPKPAVTSSRALPGFGYLGFGSRPRGAPRCSSLLQEPAWVGFGAAFLKIRMPEMRSRAIVGGSVSLSSRLLSLLEMGSLGKEGTNEGVVVF